MRVAMPKDEFMGTIEMERRKTPRRPINSGAMAVFSSQPGAGTLARVDVIDASWTGIGVRSPIAVDRGSSVSLVPESPAWPRQIGVVVRCEPDDEGGYRLGILSKRQRAVA